jgi:hypothetical protein
VSASGCGAAAGGGTGATVPGADGAGALNSIPARRRAAWIRLASMRCVVTSDSDSGSGSGRVLRMLASIPFRNASENSRVFWKRSGLFLASDLWTAQSSCAEM